MGKQKRSFIGYLTLTAWESWESDIHWRNAVIIAVIGSIALSAANHKAPTPTQNGPTSHMPSSMSGNNAQIVNPISKMPPKLAPKILADDFIIKKPDNKESNNTFGRSYGE